jgi:hypothetical protein
MPDPQILPILVLRSIISLLRGVKALQMTQKAASLHHRGEAIVRFLWAFVEEE